MAPLLLVATVLGVGWIGLWIVLARQLRRQRILLKKIEELERK